MERLQRRASSLCPGRGGKEKGGRISPPPKHSVWVREAGEAAFLPLPPTHFHTCVYTWKELLCPSWSRSWQSAASSRPR